MMQSLGSTLLRQPVLNIWRGASAASCLHFATAVKVPPSPATPQSAADYWAILVHKPREFKDERAMSKARGHGPDFRHIAAQVDLLLADEDTPEWARAVIAERDALTPTKLWELLLKEPSAFEDLRLYKEESGRSSMPDFKHIETQKALWIIAGAKPHSETIQAVIDQLPPPAPKKVSSSEETWKALFHSPHEWEDMRPVKAAGRNPKLPDFRKRSDGPPPEGEKGLALWIDSKGVPDWVADKLGSLRVEPAQSRKVTSSSSGASSSEVEWNSLFDAPHEWEDVRPIKAAGANPRLPDFRKKGGQPGERLPALWLDTKKPAWVEGKLSNLYVEPAIAKQPKSIPASSAPDGFKQEADWKALVESPHEWEDLRPLKAAGGNPKLPDFRKKAGVVGEQTLALWIDSRGVPDWVPKKLDGLQVQPARSKQVSSPLSTSDKEEVWQALFNNPLDWEDLRPLKEAGGNPRSPDFRRRAPSTPGTRGAALWLDSKDTPAWVQDKLPSLQLLPAVAKQFTGQLPAAGDRSEGAKSLWHALLTDATGFEDLREQKKTSTKATAIRLPDFKHRESGAALWLDSRSTPAAAKEKYGA